MALSSSLTDCPRFDTTAVAREQQVMGKLRAIGKSRLFEICHLSAKMKGYLSAGKRLPQNKKKNECGSDSETVDSSGYASARTAAAVKCVEFLIVVLAMSERTRHGNIFVRCGTSFAAANSRAGFRPEELSVQ